MLCSTARFFHRTRARARLEDSRALSPHGERNYEFVRGTAVSNLRGATVYLRTYNYSDSKRYRVRERETLVRAVSSPQLQLDNIESSKNHCRHRRHIGKRNKKSEIIPLKGLF